MASGWGTIPIHCLVYRQPSSKSGNTIRGHPVLSFFGVAFPPVSPGLLGTRDADDGGSSEFRCESLEKFISTVTVIEIGSQNSRCNRNLKKTMFFWNLAQ